MSGLLGKIAADLKAVHPGDVLATAGKMAGQFTRAELIAIYNGMKDDAPTILANVEPGDHGDAILEAFARRAIEAAVLRLVGAS
jgi:hypothetical protein